ncbi:MAG: ATP-binding protein [Desulfobacca sp.]|uniref:ATP-binding protein n=1 Tax=Desulfobacca sp. TaxID=2067990 RepID=UPI00404A8F05
MCEFCLKHGEGKKWYLQAKNYADDLLSDLRRRNFMRDFLSDPAGLAASVKRLEQVHRLPTFIRGLVSGLITRRQKNIHFGQIVPLEDIEEIFSLVKTIVRVTCICRQASLGQEQRYCYGVSLAPDGGRLAEILAGLDPSFAAGPDQQGLEVLTPAAALEAFRGHERQGLCHSVWTFQTPFIGGICNCDRTGCLALRCNLSYGVAVMFRGEYVAQVDPDLCVGCRECLSLCQFDALTYDPSLGKTVVAARCCYGCGVCRAGCPQDAIRLTPRPTVPAAAQLW